MDGFVEFYNTHKGDNAALIISSALSITGFLFLSAKIFSFIRLIFSLFILPGKPVRYPPPANTSVPFPQN